MEMKKKTVEIVPGVYMIGGPGVSSGDDCCVYLIESKDELCIIDTGAGKSAGMILEQVKKAGFDLEQVRFIVITHGHIDHIGGLKKFKETLNALHGEDREDYHRFLHLSLDNHPDAIIDDGADLISILVKERPGQARQLIGACEETTTGIFRLRSMDKEGSLPFPVIAVNDAYMKYLFDNRYGTGQSVWDGINRTTNLVVAGKNVVVAGYGWCGKGVSMRALGMGARVIITEIDPIKANEAIMDGFEVMTMSEAAPLGDIFITVTGNINVIRREHLELMKDNVILANAGHFDVEISKGDLNSLSVNKRQVRPNIEEFLLADGRRLYLLAEGRLVNLAAGDGHPAEVMDLSFSLQALSMLYLIENQGKLGPHVYEVPQAIDLRVARLKLQAAGVNIDRLTQEQEKYLSSWDTSL
jgi:adenosylhomocysteinase